MKKNLISVIVPVFNGEKYVEKCIGNLINQSYKAIEIIVVDDGSIDRSMDIAARYPVKIIKQENKGVSAARNVGISHADGEYIHFMDVDDSINCDFYKSLIDAIVLHDADIACCGTIDEGSRELTHFFKKCTAYQSIEKKLEVTYAGRLGYVWRYLFRADLIHSHHMKFHEGRVIEDLIFSMEAIFFSRKLVTAPNAVYTYVKANDSKKMVDLKKKEEDAVYAREVRDRFAKAHHFRIPGVNKGKIRYRLWRLFNLISHP